MAGLREKINEWKVYFEKGNLLGVDIGLSAVKVASLNSTKKGAKLLSYAFRPLTEAAIIEDEIQKPHEIIQGLMSILKEEKLSKRIACLGMDGPNTMTKRLQVPDGSKEEVEENILWEADQYISFGMDNSEVDFSLLGLIDNDEVQDVLVVAALTDVIEAYSKLLKESGLIPRIIDLNVLALVNLFELIYARSLDHLSEKGAIIIDFGAQKTTTIVYKRGGPVLTKEIAIGGVLVTEEIQRHMGVSYSEAEDLKIYGDDQGNLSEEVLAIIEQQVNEQLEEIKKVLNFYIAAGSSEQVGHCFVTGGSSRLPGLLEGLKDLVGVEVDFLNPFDVIDVSGTGLSEDELEDIALTGAVAFGLALRKIE